MTDKPKRIQMRRTKGWRKPEGAVYVGRPGKWGNPFPVGRPGPLGRQASDNAGAAGFFADMMHDPEMRARAGYPSDEEIRRDLRGKDLMCFCPLDQPCHADVLLELANKDS